MAQAPDAPLVRAEIEKGEMTEPGIKAQPVSLSLGTWIAGGALLLTFAGMMAALIAFSFQTKAAAKDHEGDFREHKVEIKGEVRLLKTVVGNVQKNVTILMDKRGLKKHVVELPEEVAEALEDDQTEESP
jgi:hypothetical protein